MSTFVSRSHGAAVLTRAFQLAGTYDYNHRVPGIEIGGVLTKVLLGSTEGSWEVFFFFFFMGDLKEQFQRTGTCEGDCRVR